MFRVNNKNTGTTSMTGWVIIGSFRGNKQGTTVLSWNTDVVFTLEMYFFGEVLYKLVRHFCHILLVSFAALYKCDR